MSGRSTRGAAADSDPAILVVDDTSAKLQPLGHPM
jgi:hypothetical protein